MSETIIVYKKEWESKDSLISSLQSEVERLRKNYSDLEAHKDKKIKYWVEKVDELKSENDKLKEEIEAYKVDCNEKTKLINSIHAKERDHRLEIERLKSSVSYEGVKPVKIRFYKHDDLQGFAAYLSPSVKKDEHGIVLLDIEASLSTALEHEIPFKELLVENMMHEFGHALEEFYDLEFSEDRIEGIIESYRKKYSDFSPSPPVVEEETVKEYFKDSKPLEGKMLDILDETYKKSLKSETKRVVEEEKKEEEDRRLCIHCSSWTERFGLCKTCSEAIDFNKD